MILAASEPRWKPSIRVHTPPWAAGATSRFAELEKIPSLKFAVYNGG